MLAHYFKLIYDDKETNITLVRGMKFSKAVKDIKNNYKFPPHTNKVELLYLGRKNDNNTKPVNYPLPYPLNTKINLNNDHNEN